MFLMLWRRSKVGASSMQRIGQATCAELQAIEMKSLMATKGVFSWPKSHCILAITYVKKLCERMPGVKKSSTEQIV